MEDAPLQAHLRAAPSRDVGPLDAGPPRHGTAPVRTGDAVRRSGGPWTGTVHALLHHIRAHGVSCVPEPLGRDAAGRDIVTFLEGTVPAYPMPDWVWEDAVIHDAARLLRRLHDATADFRRAGQRWRAPSHEPDEVICHNDFGPHNLVFRDGTVAGVIDFDTASPGPRAWDLAHLAYRLVPLTSRTNPDAPWTDAGTRALRLRLLCAAYGDGMAPPDVLAVTPARLDELAAYTEGRARDAGSSALRGHVALYEADAAYVRAYASALGGG